MSRRRFANLFSRVMFFADPLPGIGSITPLQALAACKLLDHLLKPVEKAAHPRSAIVTEEGFHQTMVDAAALRGVLERQPPIIGLHALHVLRKDDGHQFVQEAVSTILE